MSERSRLERLLGTPETAWLLERIRPRILRAEGEPLSGVVTLSQPTAAQREAMVRLLGAPRRAGASLRVDLAALEELLRRGPWPAGLADAVETLTGPVLDHRAARDQEAAEWAAARDALAPVDPDLADWWRAWCAEGGLKKAARAEAARTSMSYSPQVGAGLVAQAAAVLAQLPAGGEPLAVLARRIVGDAHGLDAQRPLGRLVATVVAKMWGGSAQPTSVREAWASVGVVLSSVASTVLCLGLPGSSTTDGPGGQAWATATSLAAMRTARMPLLLTLDQVRSGGVAPLAPDATVWVCENPTIIEVVAERWKRSGEAEGLGVLVCTSGQPSTAVVELLRHLTADGATCRYHGDFDWAGLRIAGFLATRVPWKPWRFTAADYEAALAAETTSLAITGRPATSPWDPILAASMAAHGRAIEEEAVAHVLADDLVFSEM